MKQPTLALALWVAAFGSTVHASEDAVRAANWLVGSFDNRAQAGVGSSVYKSLTLTGRPIQDPLVFTDALYVYLETRQDGEPSPNRQQVYRFKKSGKKVRLEAFTIDARILSSLAVEPQMLAQLSPGDLTVMAGCDILLEVRPDAFVGSTAGRSCRAEEEGAAYVISSIRITPDLLVILEQGYDKKGAQVSGPVDDRGYEFRRRPNE